MQNIAAIPRRRYSFGPTPIHSLPHLSEHLGGPEIFIKRDDLLGLTAGGNKTRKLEFLMADALAAGADAIVTTGAVQSNHCRLTLSAAVREGLECHLLLEERVPNSYDSHALGNNLLFDLLGAKSTKVVPGGTGLPGAMNEIAEELRREGKKPYIIPGGGSNPLGALGYFSCAQEMFHQWFEESLALDHVVCSSGSGGTHAGLAAAFKAVQQSVPLTGISVRAARADQEPKIAALATGVLELLGSDDKVVDEEIEVLDEFVGEGYSLPTPEMTEAIQLFARLEGILLDPVYTGKTAAGLIGMIRTGRLRAGQKVLFLHTGGSPALYAYPEAVRGDS